jgi:exopolysaccharide biosynthesis WecB/TagA/CpsF family protein
MHEPIPTVRILGIPIARLEPETALAEVERLHDGEDPQLVAYANAHTLNLAYRDASYRDVLLRAGLLLNDGAGVALAAHMNGTRFPANLNGSDFNPEILKLSARHGWTVFFLGARPGVADEAARRLGDGIPGLQIAGTHHGYFGSAETDDVVEAIAASGADLLMVAMGNPLQERWIDRHLSQTRARVGIGVGAFFDFTTGTIPRAPAWMNRAGIEWIHRLRHEPRRMWRRYLLGNPLFLSRVARERFAGKRAER